MAGTLTLPGTGSHGVSQSLIVLQHCSMQTLHAALLTTLLPPSGSESPMHLVRRAEFLALSAGSRNVRMQLFTAIYSKYRPPSFESIFISSTTEFCNHILCSKEFTHNVPFVLIEHVSVSA